MAPARGNPTPHRQLITYGKSSRGHKDGKGHRLLTSSPPAQTPGPLPQEPSKDLIPSSGHTAARIRQASGNNNLRQHPGALQTPQVAKPAKSTSLRHQTASYEESSVYDITLSGDEQQHEKIEPWRKRRKIESPKIEWISRGFADIVNPSPKRTRPDHTHHDSPARDVATTAAPTGPAGKTEVEVVIRTPKHLKKYYKTTTKEEVALEEGDEPGFGLPRRSKQSMANLHTDQSSHVAPNPSLSQTAGQQALKPPANTLVRPAKSSVKDPPPKMPSLNPRQRLATSARVHTGPEDDTLEQNGFTNTTPSRRRIVDALSFTPGTMPGSPINLGGADRCSRFASSRASSEISTGTSEDSLISSSQLPASLHEMKNDSRSNSPIRSQHSQTSGPKNTYARQRSFLTVGNVAEDPLLEALPKPQFAPQYQGGHCVPNVMVSKRPRSLSSHPKDDGGGDNTNGVVRNIYELRRAGENARFEGIVDAIFEDIEDPTSSASRRYSGLIQLCTKLMDHQFARRFLAYALEKRLAKRAGDLGDTIYMYLLTCAYGLILATGPVSSVVLHTCSSQVFKVVPDMISDDSDILDMSKLKAMKTSKTIQGSLRDFCEQMSQSKIWPDIKPEKPTPLALALRCIEMAVRRARESGDAIDHISDALLSKLVEVLLRHSMLLENKSAKSDDFLIIELAFSILESYTVVLSSLSPSQEKILKTLTPLGCLLSQLSHYSEPCCKQIQLLEIRLILNLTNNNPSLCEDFSTAEFIRGLMQIVLSNFGLVSEDFGNDKRDSFLDAVILALGALINLTEWSEAARQLIFKTRSNNSTTFLDRLLQLFKDGWEKTSEAESVIQTHSNVVFGYISVLLSTVSLNDGARLHLRSSLHGRTIDRVLATVDEFLHYHRKVEELHDGKDGSQGEEESSVSGFTSRLQGIVNRIRNAEGIC
ncbi:hypothetical protein GX48_02208 [Paracoccidioides brasiliensis]|nr:hypothetical protein GX48_02208 [Paracoccidioides brasiliensis]